MTERGGGGRMTPRVRVGAREAAITEVGGGILVVERSARDEDGRGGGRGRVWTLTLDS
jgi:hypothetical protein